ncbi:MAG TPA: response regulator transcription factor [Chitinophagaceae bacterium]|jgi:DNA-binding NarL/FixJ family response regulator|nr:response regulator transcription factor [Chitinophagaceae bacterium]
MVQLAIIEDNTEYRNTLSKILQRNENISMIYELDSCLEMIPYFEVSLPDVVIMDIDLPGMSGIEGVWRLKQKWPNIKVLMLTVFEDADKIFGAIKAGANGYLLKKDSPDKIINAIFSLQEGEAIMNGIIAIKVLEYFKRQADAAPKMDEYNLTEREKEILNKLIQGLSYKQIASECSIARETLNTHMKNIYRKLNVHSRAEVAARFSGHFNG